MQNVPSQNSFWRYRVGQAGPQEPELSARASPFGNSDWNPCETASRYEAIKPLEALKQACQHREPTTAEMRRLSRHCRD
jgi:hypothetical protein